MTPTEGFTNYTPQYNFNYALIKTKETHTSNFIKHKTKKQNTLMRKSTERSYLIYAEKLFHLGNTQAHSKIYDHSMCT